MKTQLMDKARANRNAALDYVDTQKSKLVNLTGFRRDALRRTPIPTFGFTSIRSGIQAAHAAA